MRTHGRFKTGAAATAAGGGSAPLEQLRRGEVTLDAYLDFRADESVKYLAKTLPAAHVRLLRDAAREMLSSDPVLIRMLRGVTGVDLGGDAKK